MSASNPLVNSPHTGFSRHPDHPYMTRPKRSDSAHFDHPPQRGLFDGASRMHDFSEEPTFIPTSLGEHLLERTYLDDVVRPLVRALVKARMTHGINGEGPTESSQAYVDLEKLRRELERSTQRARHAEQERDDLARRLDLAGAPDAQRDRVDRHPEHLGPADHSRSQLYPPSGVGNKRPRPIEFDQRSPGQGQSAVSVNVAHGDGGPGASITVTTEPPQSTPLSMVSRPDVRSPPPASYGGHPAGPRHSRPYGELHHDSHDERHHLARMPLEPEYGGYPDDRADSRFGMAASQPPHRPPLSRFSGASSARSPPSSSAYLTSSSERSSLPTLATFPSTSSSSSYSASAYPPSVHPYEQHEQEEVERLRKMARLRADGPPGGPLEYVSHAHMRPLGGGGMSNYPVTPSAETANYPVRKLASTKNRTCSNCAAPHDAKFRRGPNGPGTLCDRCGSRWKKFKEQEQAGKRDSIHSETAAPAAAAAQAAQARLGSTTSGSGSSQSPPEPGEEVAAGNGKVSANVSPADGDGQRERERERSASVDQLVDE